MERLRGGFDYRRYRKLWMFLVVAEEGNIGKAAERLAMSQPPLSEHIKSLEDDIGAQLFDRSRRGTSLTSIGRLLLPAVQRFVQQARDLDFTIDEVVAGQSGVIRIGAITASMLSLVPSVVKGIQQEYPDLSVRLVEIDSAEALPALERKEIDLAFVRIDKELGGGIETLPLHEDTLAIALPKAHRFAKRRRVNLKDLADDKFVFSARSVSPVYFDALMSACREKDFAPRVHSEVRSIASQIAFVACNQGVALVPKSMRPLAPDRVVFKPLTEQLSVVTMAVVWRSDNVSPEIGLAVELLRAGIRG